MVIIESDTGMIMTQAMVNCKKIQGHISMSAI